MNREQRAPQQHRKVIMPGTPRKRKSSLCTIGRSLLVPGLVLLMTISAAADDQLGRFFFSAEERTGLEALRWVTDQDSLPPPAEAIVPPATSDIAATDLYSLGGLITRQSVLQAVWLNEQRYTLPALPENISQDQTPGPEEILLQVPQSAQSYPLRPGQRLDLNNNRVWEVYERGWQRAVPIPTEEAATPEEAAEPQAALQAASE